MKEIKCKLLDVPKSFCNDYTMITEFMIPSPYTNDKEFNQGVEPLKNNFKAELKSACK